MHITAHFQTIKRLLDGGRSADFDDVVHAYAVGELEYFLVPVGRLGVVDEVRRAERFGLLELVVRGRGRDDSCARCGGELEAEAAHAEGQRGRLMDG